MYKETKYINLWDLQKYPENFLSAKIDIEKDLPEENKKTLTEFISSLGLNSVYMNNGVMIPYSYIKGNDSDYVMYFLTIDNTDNEKEKAKKENAFKAFSLKLSKIKYDSSNLSKKTNFELVEMSSDVPIELGEYFIIENEFYV